MGYIKKIINLLKEKEVFQKIKKNLFKFDMKKIFLPLIIKIKKIFFNIKIKEKLIGVKHFFTKEKLINVKSFFTKDNLKIVYKDVKIKFLENKKIYAAFISLLVAISIGSIAYISSRPKSVEAVNQKKVNESDLAEEYYYSGQYDKSIEEFKKLLEKDSLNALWYAKIGEVYSIKGDIENSRTYLDKAKSQQNIDVDTLNKIVFTQLINKDYVVALETGKSALAKFPDNKGLIKTMFSVYMANNKLEEAKNVLETYPVDVKSAYDLAEYAKMLMVAGKWEEGYKELRGAFDVDRDEYKIYDVLAQISIYNKDTLLQNITALSQNNPNDLAYKMWLAKVYSLSEATADEANKLIEELKPKDVGKIEIKLIEASVLQNLKQNDKADELIKNVIEGNKDDYRVLHTASWYYLNKGEYFMALKYCNESIAKNKDYTDNYGYLMPEIFKKIGRTKEGEPYFRTALYMEPYNYNIMLSAADYFLNNVKDNEKALQYFEFAEAMKPSEPEIKYSIAEINISNSKVDEAIKSLKEAIELSDDTAKYHRTLGTIYLLNGNPDEAIKEIRYAYGSDQEDILTLNNAGCYYVTQTVNFVKAEYNLRKAVEGITPATDKYISDTINENYKKLKELMNQYESGNGNTLKMPEFVLFY